MEELWIVIGVIGILLLIALFCYLQNNAISHTRINIKTNKMKNGLRIINLSDLHSKIFSRNRLFREVKRENPDFIFFTGDVADRYKSDEKAFDAVNELSKLIEIAPVIAVSGNHEYGRLNREELFSYMEKRGIKLLRKERLQLEHKDDLIKVFGLDEVGWPHKTEELLNAFSNENGYKILLSHFPERFSQVYSKYDIDLTLSGHAHGGQFILPFIGGLYSPGQGIHPHYYRGLYEIGENKLVVSRGLGNSRFPLRLFNYPDIVTIEINIKNK